MQKKKKVKINFGVLALAYTFVKARRQAKCLLR